MSHPDPLHDYNQSVFTKSWEMNIKETNIKLGYIKDGDASRYYLKQDDKVTSLNDEAGKEFWKLCDHKTESKPWNERE